MTDDASRAAAPSTYELYAGAHFFENSISGDLLDWLDYACGVHGWREDKRRSNAHAKLGDEAVVEVCMRLYDVCQARCGKDEPGFLKALIDTQTLCMTMNAARLVADFVLDEIVQRLAIYRVELGDRTAVEIARVQATDFARNAAAGDPTVLFALGLSLAHPQSSIWTTPPGSIRRAMIEEARELVGPPRAISPLKRIPATATDPGGAPDDPVDYERNGIVKWPPTRVVVPQYPSDAKGKYDAARGEAKRIAGVRLPLVTVPENLPEIAAELRMNAPHAAGAIDAILRPLAGRPWVKTRNILLHGSPGTGKSALAQEIARALGMHCVLYNCAGSSDSSYAGTSRQWSSARSSVSLQALIAAMKANAFVVLDEIDKTGSGDHNGSLRHALLPFLEATTNGGILDPGVELTVDVSQVSYVATANDLGPIPRPLLDRFQIVEVPDPEWHHLGDLARGIVERLRRERETSPDWLPDLDGEEIEAISRVWQGGSIRGLRRYVEAVVDARDALAPRH